MLLRSLGSHPLPSDGQGGSSSEGGSSGSAGGSGGKDGGGSIGEGGSSGWGSGGNGGNGHESHRASAHGSITPSPWDVISCIEVIEHLPSEEDAAFGIYTPHSCYFHHSLLLLSYGKKSCFFTLCYITLSQSLLTITPPLSPRFLHSTSSHSP